MSKYETGSQPCKNFKAQDDGLGGNEHSCMKHAPESCVGNVSFCTNCYTDHHSSGYENCKKEPN